MRQPTLTFAICLHGRLVVLAPFPYLFRSHISEALHLPLPLRSKRARTYSVGVHVPNAMFVFAFEGALLAFTYNGDRFVLLALLPRSQPRTSFSAAAFFQPHQRRVLRFPCDVWPLAWISVQKCHLFCLGRVTHVPRSFRRRASALLCFRLSQRFDNRCRTRCTQPRTRARCRRPRTTETGTCRQRSCRGASRAPASCQQLPQLQ